MTSESSSVRAPRIAVMVRDEGGFGFNLHGERGVVGQFVSAVDDGGIADKAGLCIGDRIVEVNGVNVESATHSQVVAKVREDPKMATLLVIDKVTDDFLKQHNIPITSELAKVESVLEILQKDEEEKKAVEVEPEISVQDNKVVESPTYEEIKDTESVEPEAQKEVEVQNTEDTEQESVEPQKEVQETEEAEFKEQESVEPQKEVEIQDANAPDEVQQDVHDTIIQQDTPDIVIQKYDSGEVQDSTVDADQITQVQNVENVATEPEKISEPDVTGSTMSENHVPEQNGPSDENQNLPENNSTSETKPEREPEPETRPQTEKLTQSQNSETKAGETVSNSTNGGLKLTSMAAALPKPKRKSIKEEKAGSWASKAAMFNNL